MSVGRFACIECWPWVTFSHPIVRSEGRMRRSVHPLVLRSCSITWHASLDVGQSQEFQWLQETEVGLLPWQWDWLVRTNSTLVGQRKMAQDMEQPTFLFLAYSLIVYITHFLTFHYFCFESDKSRIPFIYWITDNKLYFVPFFTFLAYWEKRGKLTLPSLIWYWFKS